MNCYFCPNEHDDGLQLDKMDAQGEPMSVPICGECHAILSTKIGEMAIRTLAEVQRVVDEERAKK